MLLFWFSWKKKIWKIEFVELLLDDIEYDNDNINKNDHDDDDDDDNVFSRVHATL